MFTVNLEKELKKQNASEIEEAEKFLALVKDHIYDLEAQEERTMNRVFPGYRELDVDKAKNSRVIREYAELNKVYDGNVFTESQIKALCIKYNLRFLPTSYYKGSIDPETPIKIREFESIINKQIQDKGINHYCYSDIDYYIAAPKRAFKLEVKPKDPLLFARISKDHYVLVHKWGNDLSVFRRVSGFFSCYSPMSIMVTLSILFFVASSVYGIFNPFANFYGEDNGIVASILAALTTSFVFCGLVIAIMFMIELILDKDEWATKGTNNTWNSKFK